MVTSYGEEHSQTRAHAGKPSLEARVLAFIALARRGVEFEDLRHAAEFAAAGDHELCVALRQLLKDGRVALRLAPVRYRMGEQFLRREVPVYYLAPSAERGQA